MPAPADNMADLVMQQITAATQDEVVINPALKTLLQQHATDAAPLDLMRNVMGKINPQPAQASYAPLISKKAWYGAAAMLGLLILLSLLGSPADHSSNRFIANTVKQINAMPSLYIIILSFSGLLMVVDHLITGKLKLSKPE